MQFDSEKLFIQHGARDGIRVIPLFYAVCRLPPLLVNRLTTLDTENLRVPECGAPLGQAPRISPLSPAK
jgi:hypothetical protein